MVNKIHDLNIFGKEWIPKKNYFWMKLCAETMKENFLDSHLFYRAEKKHSFSQLFVIGTHNIIVMFIFAEFKHSCMYLYNIFIHIFVLIVFQ